MGLAERIIDDTCLLSLFSDIAAEYCQKLQSRYYCQRKLGCLFKAFPNKLCFYFLNFIKFYQANFLLHRMKSVKKIPIRISIYEAYGVLFYVHHITYLFIQRDILSPT